MKNFLLVLPIALLVTYSQLVMKWRAGPSMARPEEDFVDTVARFLGDPLILSAYAAALAASFAWLYVVTKLPLTVAFPVYIGVTFAMVLLGSWVFLAEALSVAKLLAVLLIFAGIVLGVGADV